MIKIVTSSKVRLVIAVLFFIAALIIRSRAHESLSLYFFIASYLVAGTGVIWQALRSAVRGNIFSEHFLMTIATVGAFVIGEYAEGCAVMLLFLLGSELEDRAVDRTRRSIDALRNIRPEIAHRVVNGETIDSDPCSVQPGEQILVYPGERVPLDSKLLSDSAFLDYSALTGESRPIEKERGEEILAGAINGSHVLTLETLRDEQHSAVMRIMRLADEAEQKKAKIESFTARFARVYTPIVVILALLLAFLPSLLGSGQALSVWVYRALNFLVISCPCSLVISVPLAFIAGMGIASKRGILIRGSQYLEALADLDTIVFDKTGTLTTGEFSITHIESSGVFSQRDFIQLIADLESHSNHPLALAISKLKSETAIDTSLATEAGHNVKDEIPVFMTLNASSKKELLLDEKEHLPGESDLTDIQEIAGHGMSALLAGKRILIGNKKLLDSYGVHLPASTIERPSSTLVYVAFDGAWAGTLYAEDTLRHGAGDAVRRLREKGSTRISILSGDRKENVEATARELGTDDVYSQLLPEEKVHYLERILGETKGRTAFVGDGINDAPVLRLADIGIGMGALGSDAAVEAADIVIMTDQLERIPDAVSIASQTRSRVRENVIFILLVKGLLLALGAFGITTLWAAVFADTGVMLLTVLNALRASYPRGLTKI